MRSPVALMPSKTLFYKRALAHSLPVHSAYLLPQTFSSPSQTSLTLFEALEILKVGLGALSPYFSSFLPWHAFFPPFSLFLLLWWPACVFCGIFLIVGSSLGCLVHFRFSMKHLWYVFQEICLVKACMHIFMFSFGHICLDLLYRTHLITNHVIFVAYYSWNL